MVGRSYFCAMLAPVAKVTPRTSSRAATRTPARPAPQADGPAQLNMKLPHELLQSMDALVEEINGTRDWPKMTRSDLIRLVVGRAIKERPSWLMGAEEK